MLVADTVPEAIESVVRFTPAPYETVLPTAIPWLAKPLGTAEVRFSFTTAVNGTPIIVAAIEIEPGLPAANVIGTPVNATIRGGLPTVRFKF